VPLAILVAGIVRPAAALLIFTAALPLLCAPPGGPNLGVLDLSAWVLILVLWRAGRPVRTPADAPAACFLWVSLASLALLAYRPPAWRPGVLLGLIAALPGAERGSLLFTWRAAATALVGWLLFVAVRRLGADAARWLGWGLAGGLGITLVLALGEWAGGVDLSGYRPRLEASGEALYSLFFAPASLALFLIAATPLAAVALWSRSSWWRWVAAGLAVASSVVAFRTLERGAWLAVGLQIVLAAFLAGGGRAGRRARRRTLALVAIGLVFAVGTLIGAAVASDDLRDALERPRSVLSDPSVLGRGAGASRALEMISDRPLLGSGLGSFSLVEQPLPGGESPGAERRHTAGSLYLMIAAERGLLGLAAFGLLALTLLGALWRRLRSPDREVSRFTRAALVTLAGLGVYGVVYDVFFVPAIEWLCWMVVGASATLTAAAAGAPARSASAPNGAGAGYAQARHGGAVAKVLALVVAGVALSQFLAHPPTPAPTSAWGGGAFGWHAPQPSGEGEMQWTSGRADLRLERAGDVLVLPAANGHPRPKARPVEVRILLNGEEVDRFRPGGEWEERRIQVAASVAEPLVLSIRAHPTFRPYREARRLITLPDSRDLRLLGVAVGPPRWESSPPDAKVAASASGVRP
jgi:O-antigen ligase